MELSGSTVLVTGANGGIGFALVARLLERGAARVHAADVVLDRLTSLDDDRITLLELDVTDDERIAATAGQVERLDLLINCAGVLTGAGPLAGDLDAIEHELQVHYLGPLRMTRAFLPLLVESGGAIVTMLSVAALASMPSIGAYSSAKAAAHSLTQGLRAQLAETRDGSRGLPGPRRHADDPGPPGARRPEGGPARGGGRDPGRRRGRRRGHLPRPDGTGRRRALALEPEGGGAAIRDGLIGFVDRYLDSVAANDPAGLPVTDDVRFTENGQELAPGTGLWAIAVGENGVPAGVFVRLKVDDGRISEIETIVRRPHPRLYAPENLAETRAIVFEHVDPGERSSREELARIANLYFDGLEQVDGGLIPFAEQCIRVENGQQTVLVEDVSAFAGSTAALIFPLGAREQIDSGYFAYLDAVRDRRVVAVDEARGLVVVVVVFDHSARRRRVQVKGIGEVEVAEYHQRPNSVLIGELFKVRAGEIVHIEAVLELLPYGVRTGWEA
jgi:hypothetical protein